MKARRALLVPLFGLLLGAALQAQLDLPGKGKRFRKEPVAPLLPPEPPKGDVAPKEGALPLDLPGAKAGSVPLAAAPTPLGPEADARALFGGLERLRTLESSAAALEHLLALGPNMLPIARAELGVEKPLALLVAGRACLIAGGPEERAAVAERLRRAVPAEVAAPLLEELLARDPVLASPEYLAGLLDHPTASLRSAAAKALEVRLSVANLAALAPALASSRSAARAAALELVARVSDPAAWNLLAGSLSDSNAELAQRAATLLAGLDAAEGLLLARAFPPAADPLTWDRGRAYAVLALIEREDAQHSVLLDETRIDALRAGLNHTQPLIAGACAAALARVGFRSPPSRTGAWLDRDVPHQLVRSGTGAEFHADFRSLERPTLRALALLSGESFGQDGEAARRWWVEHAEGFQARHAVIERGPDAAAQLSVLFDDDAGQRYALLGPARSGPGGTVLALLLDEAAAERLLADLAEQGLFGIECLPGGTRTGAERLLSVAVGEQQKQFSYAPGTTPWFDALRVALLARAEDNRWQLYFDPTQSSAHEFWLAEHERWAGLTPLERRRAMKPLLIGAAQRAKGAGRDAHLAALVRLYAEVGVPEAADFEPLLSVLAGESAFGPRAEQLIELARIAAGAAGDERAESAPRERLLALVLEHFAPITPAVEQTLISVARDLPTSALRALAGDARPEARALSAAGLVRAPQEGELVQGLLADREPRVQLAVLAALLDSPREDARGALLERSKTGSGEVRTAALHALARLGGKDAQDAALEALGDPAPEVQAAGVAALADLADPGSASLLASLFARGPGSPLFADARRGLKRLGPAGLQECLRLTRTANKRARHEATLVLSEALAPEAAGLLLTLLSEDGRDARVVFELSVLAGLDFGAEQDVAAAVGGWWDLVLHDDPLAWLLAAGERSGLRAPPRGALEGPGTLEGAQFLLALAALPSAPLVERATRELELRLGHEFTRPSSNTERSQLQAELAEAVRARYGE